MKYRLLRNFLKGCSLTTALFVFQACYGTAQGLDWEVRDINFRVLNTEGAALEKAKVLMKENRTCRRCNHARCAGTEQEKCAWDEAGKPIS